MAKKHNVFVIGDEHIAQPVNLGQVYSQLREKVLDSDPMATSTNNLAALGGYRYSQEGHYGWELYKTEWKTTQKGIFWNISRKALWAMCNHGRSATIF